MIFSFFIAVLVTWRLTYMVQNENLPFNAGGRLRKALRIKEFEKPRGYTQSSDIKPGSFRDLMSCFKCLSFWFALPCAIYLVDGFILIAALTIAIGTAAIFVQTAAERYGL